MPAKQFFIVDISSYVFRAYYGIRPLTTSKGIPTHATYGVITMLLKLIREKKPDYLAIVFDSPVQTFRKELYAEYKANRVQVPEDLPIQFEYVKRFVDSYPMAALQQNGFEADDLIASLVTQYRNQSMRLKEPVELVIVSADKDLMQLVGPGVTMYDSMKERRIAEPEVLERFGVGPDKVRDILALAGDTSDNIPGVKGIGEKTAIKLIQQWGSVENLLEHVDEIPGKMGQNIRECRDLAILSKRLATLRDDLEMNPDWKAFEMGSPKQEVLNALYQELELRTLVQALSPGTVSEGAGAPAASTQDEPPYELILTESDLQKWVQKIKAAPDGFAFDTETTGLDPFRCRLVGVSFAVAEGEACYIPIEHSYLGCPEQLPKETVIRAIKPLLEDPNLPKYGQNAKFDMEVLSQSGITVQGLAGDSLLASYLINPEGEHNLDHLALEYLNRKTVLYEEVVPKGGLFSDVEVQAACRYAAEDADVTFRLIAVLHPILKRESLWDCYRNIELPLMEVLFRMESTGVWVAQDFLKKLSVEFTERIKTVEAQIFEHAGFEFNVQSPKQIADILFVKLGLPPQKKTKTGYSTDVGVLTELSSQHPLPALLLQHRMLAKLKSTYIDQLQNLVHPTSKRIHTSYNQTIAATGRLSSTEPNLQNIPIRTEEGRRIRQAFVAPAGHLILSADYSQIELRLLAAFSKEESLVAAFKNNQDIHHLTAEKVFKKSAAEITPDLRARAKTVNFGILYGQSPFGLSKLLTIPMAEAKTYIQEFFNQYPAVASYKEKALLEAKAAGEVRTWSGRRRLVPDLRSENPNMRQNAERMAFNAIFQGSAADLIKVAMIHIDRRLREEKLKTRMIMQVHDELVFEVPEDELDRVRALVCELMENAIPCEVPLKVEAGVGPDWSSAH